jgi:DNA-binding response OmpR family regulator
VKQILLVEDDPFLIDIYTTKLKRAGFKIEVASDGSDALRKLNEERFDLLVLDIVLPKIDGWEILEKIKNRASAEAKVKMRTKSSPPLKDLKIVVLSNLGQKGEVEKGLKLGAIKYLIKAHYTPSQVVAEIKQLLSEG